MKRSLIIVLVIAILISVSIAIYSKKTKNLSPISLDTNFLSENKTGKSLQTLTLISTGDIGLVRDINYQIQQRHDPDYPFSRISDYLRSADLTVINLEGPLIKNCPIIITGFKFCGSDTNVKGLVDAGIDAVTVANNHSINYGLEGLSETANILKSNGIKPFGLESGIEYLDVKGKKVALVGFVELGNNWAGLNNATQVNVAKLVSEAKTKAGIVISAFHWGVEYTRKPTQNQISLAHIAIDNGADIVLGNHPHWIQENEIYKDRFISYAQGNMIFDQDWSQETKEGVIYKFEYQDGKFNKVDEKYTIIEQNIQPRFATEKETKMIKQKIPNNLN